ncbi:protein UXT isoform X1 [Rhinatrema bivittatum]|uniref:protein UXT isoform X1 n=1 Tax=Rhinatrema bivittatum TaxID=194408 RepID=UPI00112683EA|nr:protein UXT isoform X1 [Rhinatrema bivittatum]
MEAALLQKKVLEYEKFISEVLQRDLSKVLEQRDEIYKTIAQYLQLKNTIERLQELDDKALKTEVDLGCNFFVCAEVPDSSRIFMALGYGFFAELTLEEALRFIEKKNKLLTDHTVWGKRKGKSNSYPAEMVALASRGPVDSFVIMLVAASPIVLREPAVVGWAMEMPDTGFSFTRRMSATMHASMGNWRKL